MTTIHIRCVYCDKRGNVCSGKPSGCNFGRPANRPGPKKRKTEETEDITRKTGARN